jgi:hypothetical protein
MDILPDTAGGRIQDRCFFNPGIVIAHDQEDPRIGFPKLPAQFHKILNQEIINEIPMRKIQSLMGMPRMGENVAADEYGLGLFPEDRLKKRLITAYPAVEVGDKEGRGHGKNDTEKPRGRQLHRIRP